MFSGYGLLTAVLSGFVLAPFAPLIVRYAKHHSGWVIAALPAALTVYFAGFVYLLHAREKYTWHTNSVEWAPGLGIELAFHPDGLGLLMAFLISGIGALIMIYAERYLREHEHLGRFYVAILMFMSSMLGIVLTDNIFVLYVFWELTTFTSFLMIGFEHEDSESRYVARQALLVTTSGGLALLVGSILLVQVTGTDRISEIVKMAPKIQSHEFALPALFLILLGAFTKSAQFPFHFWLPNAMQAPAPVSAYLHSATMVKAGVYLMARLRPAFIEMAAWQWTLLCVGGATALLGSVLSLRQENIKLMLAYMTVMGLGLMTMLLGLAEPQAVDAVILFLIAHSVYKGALFLTAGTVEHVAHTKNITELQGVARNAPGVVLGLWAAAITMAGLPPTLGYVAKEVIYKSSTHDAKFGMVATAIAVLSEAAAVAIGLILAIQMTFGTRKSGRAVSVPFVMWMPPLVFGTLGVFLGVFNRFTGAFLVEPAVSSVLMQKTQVDTSLWHGFNLELVLSFTSVGLGVLGYLFWSVVRARLNVTERVAGVLGPSVLYGHSLRLLERAAITVTRLLQSGHLSRYILIVLLFLSVITSYSLVPSNTFHWTGRATLDESVSIYFSYVVLFMGIIAAVSMVYSRTIMALLVSFGALGFSVALIYLILAGPDLAMTQFLVETVSAVIFVLVLLRRKVAIKETRSSGTKLLHSAIAAFFGVLVFTLSATVVVQPFDTSISDFFVANSYLKAHSRNIVNTILVDFRSFDTLGEITVLAIAGLGVFGAVRSNRRRREFK